MRKTMATVLAGLLAVCVLLGGCVPPGGTADGGVAAATADGGVAAATADGGVAAATTDGGVAAVTADGGVAAATADGGVTAGASVPAGTAEVSKLLQYDDLPVKTVTDGTLLDYPFYSEGDVGFDNLKALGKGKLLFTVDSKLYLYYTASNKAEEIGSYADTLRPARTSPQGALFADDRYYVYSDYQMYMVDTEDKTSVVWDGGVNPAVAKYSENEIIYAYFENKDNGSKAGERFLCVKVYDITAKKSGLLFPPVSVDPQTMYSVYIYNKDVYLLHNVSENNKFAPYIDVYNSSGELFRTIKNIDVGNGDNTEVIGISGFYVCDGVIFIEVRDVATTLLFGYLDGSGTLTQFYGNDTNAEGLYSGYNGMNRLARNEKPVAVVDDRYVYMTAGGDRANELLVFDVKAKTAARFRFDIDGYAIPYEVVVDEKGNAVVTLVDRYADGKNYNNYGTAEEAEAYQKNLGKLKRKYYYISYDKFIHS